MTETRRGPEDSGRARARGYTRVPGSGGFREKAAEENAKGGKRLRLFLVGEHTSLPPSLPPSG